jgi:hypothetical protein
MFKLLIIGLLSLMPFSQAAQQQSSPNSGAFTSEIWNAWNTTPRDAIRDSNWPTPLHTDVPTTLLIYTDGKKFSGKAIVDSYPGYGDFKHEKHTDI